MLRCRHSADLHTDMRADMSIELCMHTCAGMCTEICVCVDICVAAAYDRCVDVPVDTCMNMCTGVRAGAPCSLHNARLRCHGQIVPCDHRYAHMCSHIDGVDTCAISMPIQLWPI